MSAPLRVVLSIESDRTLMELRVVTNLPQQIKDRAHMVRLNAQGWNVPAIAEIFECQEQTVRVTLRRWEQGGLGGLWDASGRGAKPKWKEEDIAYLEECLDLDQRTYTSVQLALLLEQKRQVKRERRPDSPDSAKKGFRWKRTRHSQQRQEDPEQKQLKQADLETLELAAQAGHIDEVIAAPAVRRRENDDLNYLDEAGFC